MAPEKPVKRSGGEKHVDDKRSPGEPNPSSPKSDIGYPHQSQVNNSPKHNESNVSPSKRSNKKKNDLRRRTGSHKKGPFNDDKSDTTGFQTKRSIQPNTPTKKSEFKPSESKDSMDTFESKHSDTITNVPNSRHSETRDQDFEELKERCETLNNSIKKLNEHIKLQADKIKELELCVMNSSKKCNQLDNFLQNEISCRTRLETEKDSMTQTISRLKAQLLAHEKNKFNSDELIRVLNATLMERETEISILKLKFTRMQTNPSSATGLNSSMSQLKPDPCQSFASSGRSNSEFDRNSYIRSSMVAEAASTRASTSQLRAVDKDASVWATVPEELTPSKKPHIVERNFQQIYNNSNFNPYGNNNFEPDHASTPITPDRRYKTLPRSMKNPAQDLENKCQLSNEANEQNDSCFREAPNYQVTNLDDSNNTSQSSGNRTIDFPNSYNFEVTQQLLINNVGLPQSTPGHQNNTSNNRSHNNLVSDEKTTSNRGSLNAVESCHYSTIEKACNNPKSESNQFSASNFVVEPPSLPARIPTTPAKSSSGLKKIFDKLRRSSTSADSQSKTDLTNLSNTPPTSPFKRNANRSTLVGPPSDIRAHITPIRQAMNFQTNRPFAEWDTDMLVDWLTMIGLSMYTAQCKRWVECGAHIMNATPAEVDKVLGITNHLHRKKLRLAISELNGDCDKVTKAAARLDYLWVARWLDDIGLPQYKEAFINARVDGRVLNYLTVEDLVSMGIRSILHHASIRCGIRVLRSLNFDLQLLKRRATADEIEQMSSIRQRIDLAANETKNLSIEHSQELNKSINSEVPLWTCHRVMEWLRMIDFAEFAPNLRGSGVHGGLIVFEDGFNIDTLCALLSIPIGRTLLRRHLSTFFKELVGTDLAQKKRQHQDLSPNQQLNPTAEIKSSKKSQMWFSKLKSSKVGQDGMDEYLCPMYPVEPPMIQNQGSENSIPEEPESRAPASINV